MCLFSVCHDFERGVCLTCAVIGVFSLSFVSLDTFVSAASRCWVELRSLALDFQLTFLLPIFRQAFHLRSEHTCDRAALWYHCHFTSDLCLSQQGASALQLWLCLTNVCSIFSSHRHNEIYSPSSFVYFD